MTDLPIDGDLVFIEEALWLLEKRTHKPTYDFAFDTSFACRRPWQRPEPISAVARVGAPHDYEELFRQLTSQGVTLVNSPQQHLNASELPDWYPRIEDITPKSAWFDTPPPSQTVADTVGWPVFVKGARQTSRHDPRSASPTMPANTNNWLTPTAKTQS